MKRKYYLKIACYLLIQIHCAAQHCQYCTTAIVGIHPISALSKKTINGLYIYVVNESGIQYNGLNSIVDPTPTDNETISKTVLFWQNDSVKSHKNNTKKHFTFSKNHYLFRSFWTYSSQKDKSKLYIKIEDRDGEENGGKFKTQVIPVSELKQKSMCGYDYPNFNSDDYAPLTIELETVKARDSTKVIRTVNNFRFEFDPSPLANCPECNGCICKSLQVSNGLGQVIFERIFMEETLRDNYVGVDSIQVADYNFDGYPDFRIITNNKVLHQYYVYDSKKKTFTEEPLLSRLTELQFDFNNKAANGILVDSSPTPSDVSSVSETYLTAYKLSGGSLVDVRIIRKFWYSSSSIDSSDQNLKVIRNNKIDTSYYSYRNFALEKKTNAVIYSTAKTVGDFKFDLTLNSFSSNNNYNNFEYIQLFKVTAISTNKNIHTTSIKLQKVSIDNRNHCTDSIEVADYNFDGYPDFRICQYSSKYLYKVFDKEKNTFVDEPLLNQMEDIEFDFANKIAKATKFVSTLKKGAKPMWPNADRTEKFHSYSLAGKGLNYVNEHITIDSYNNNKQSTKSEVNYYTYSQYKLNSVSESNFKKMLNPSSVKEYNVVPFIFKLDKNAMSVKIPSEKGAYANRIEVLEAKNRKVVFSQIFYGNKLKSPFICFDSLQIADFNFDGYPDFRLCNFGSKHTYYIYYKKKKTFIEETRLSELFNVEFDYTKKLATGNKNSVSYDLGMHTNTIKVSLSAEELSNHINFSNNTIQQPVVSPNNPVLKKDTVIVVTPKLDELNKKLVETQFIKQWKNYQFKLIFNPKGIRPSTEHCGYAKKLEVRDLKTDTLIYERTIKGNTYQEQPICKDSLLIDDFNFDGYPDYKMCDDYEGKRFKYYLYDDKKKNFIEDLLLSSLINVTVYQDSIKLVGFRSYGSASEQVDLFGRGLPVAIITSIDESDMQYKKEIKKYSYKNGQLNEMTTPLPNGRYSRIVSGFRYELIFSPENVVIPAEKGAYVKQLNIYKCEKGNIESKLLETLIYGNEFKETRVQRDSFEIANYNFDTIPDVRFNNSLNPGQSAYYLSAIDSNENETFYNEYNLSNLQQMKRFDNRKKLNGTYTDITDFNTVSFYGMHLDTMVVVKQNLNTLALTQTKTYLNKLGKLRPIPNIKALEPKPKTKKELGDYNFDGHEDFRAKKSENDERWEFFIYNSRKKSFELDTLLSKMTSTYFDFENEVFVGQITKQITELDTYTEGYKTVNGKIILYSTSTCHRRYRFAEGADCTISELKNGTWIETFIKGAE